MNLLEASVLEVAKTLVQYMLFGSGIPFLMQRLKGRTLHRKRKTNFQRASFFLAFAFEEAKRHD